MIEGKMQRQQATPGLDSTALSPLSSLAHSSSRDAHVSRLRHTRTTTTPQVELLPAQKAELTTNEVIPIVSVIVGFWIREC